MTHAFDTGASAPQRTRIQRGAISLLAGLKRSAGGYLMDVIPFAFTLRPTTSNDDAAQFVSAISRAPAIAIAIGDRRDRTTGVGGFGAMGEIDLLVYFSSNNARNQQLGRQEIDTAGTASDIADPGLHVMMEHARELLLGRRLDLGTDIKQIRLDAEEEILTAQPISIWLQTYKITVLTQIAEFRSVTQLLESLRFRAAVNPAEVAPPAPKIDHATIDVQEDGLS